VSDQFLEIASPEPPSASPGEATQPLASAVAELAEALTADDAQPTSVRIATVTAIESTGSRRVKLDITGSTAWVTRTADAELSVGDRVWAVQQGPLLIVVGRVTGVDTFTPIGALMPFAGSSATIPSGWLLCDGSAVSRTTFAGLFAVVGTTYGAGNGSTTFNLPSLTDRIPVGSGNTYSRGTTGGAATVALSSSQMPSHSHSFSGSADSGGSHSHSLSGSTDSSGSHSHSEDATTTRSDLLAGGGTNAALPAGGSTGSAGAHSHGLSGSASTAGSHSHNISGSVGSTGSGSAHENMPPFLAMPYIIRAT
jgi:microcystin-dependent protein